MTVREPAPVQPRPRQNEPEEPDTAAQEHPAGEELIDGVDRLLDDIDAVLEEQAVLVNYRQRSGQ